MKPLLVSLMLLVGTGASADDFVSVPEGPLSDKDFYRLVACSASPKAACKDRIVRWPVVAAADLTVGIVAIDPDFPRSSRALIRRALSTAIAEINAAGAGLTLRLAPVGARPDIAVHLLGLEETDVIDGSIDPDLAGGEMGAGYVYVWWNGRGEITRAIIAFARDIHPDDIRSIALEELVQATGLLTDIDNPWYRRRSIFSQDSNEVTRLQPQDLMALRRHYPP
ncbi:DUF2927 domain-containing protein [uncultured Roseobacter sp.]|uniref:DUF2927 domain-containing protein n=1 Tax=uncultured Roseobacter sp. TaxID=114847 RepID=UPI0026290327|nr:DUF2927 domain-containing protein [uncultured Roseobacter sp.]